MALTIYLKWNMALLVSGAHHTKLDAEDAHLCTGLAADIFGVGTRQGKDWPHQHNTWRQSPRLVHAAQPSSPSSP